MKIALFFGSFNPIHSGHQQLAGYLLQHELVDEVWMVISPCNPLKNQSELIDEYLRLDMVILATKDISQIKASDIEFTLPIPSYTIDTLKIITKQYPEHQFTLFIGSDNALVFDQWKNYRELLANYKVLVYPRQGYDFAEVADKYPELKLIESPFYNISSTEIRNAIAQKKDVSKWLHPSVLDYIVENSLYV